MLFVVILAVVVVLGLAAYALYLHKLLRDKKNAEIAQQNELAAKAREKRDEVNRSIQILAQNCESDQLTLTEASIRISGLLSSLGVDDAVREEFSAFYQLADATSHIPFLADWQMLERSEKKRLTLERETLEAQHQDFVLSAAKRILGRSF